MSSQVYLHGEICRNSGLQARKKDLVAENNGLLMKLGMVTQKGKMSV